MKKLGLVVLVALMLVGCGSKAAEPAVTNKAFEKSDILETESVKEESSDVTKETAASTVPVETTVAETKPEDIMTNEELVDRIVDMGIKLAEGSPNRSTYDKKVITRLVDYNKRITLAAYYMMLIDQHPEEHRKNINDLHMCATDNPGLDGLDELLREVKLTYYDVVSNNSNALYDAETDAIERHDALLARIAAEKQSMAESEAESKAVVESIAAEDGVSADAIVWGDVITDKETLRKELMFNIIGGGEPVEMQLGKSISGKTCKRVLWNVDADEPDGFYKYCEWDYTNAGTGQEVVEQIVDAKTLAECSEYYLH